MQILQEISAGSKLAGDSTRLLVWKIDAYMQPGEAFMVVRHSMSTIYSTMTDITTLHGKVVLFIGDCKGTRECIPFILPPQSTFEWKKCYVIDDKDKLFAWYADNPSEYGILWNPTLADGTRVDCSSS